MSYQLAAHAIKGAVDRAGVTADQFDEVVLGTVIHNVKTPKCRARSRAHGWTSTTDALPYSVSSLHLSQSSHLSSRRSDSARTGRLGGCCGVDCASDTPILFRRPMRKKLMGAQKLRSMWDYIKFAFTLRPRDFVPEQPQVAEFLTNTLDGR